MSNKIEEYLSGSINKPKINKTRWDFVKEWLNSLFVVRKLVYLIVALLGAQYVFDSFFGSFEVPQVIANGIGVLIFPLVAIAVLIFIIRTISVILMFIFPDIKAKDFSIENGTIAFLRLDGKKDTYNLDTTENFILTYNFRGLLIHTTKGITYTLALAPEEIEKRLDGIPNFHKQVTFIESREGDVRTVWYGNPVFGAENKSFTATNKGLARRAKNQ